MKFIILLTVLALSIFSFSSIAQKRINTAYAITSEKQGAFVWTEVRHINLETGEILQNVFETNKGAYSVFNARNGKPIVLKDAKGQVTEPQQLPFSGYSAACAYDKKHNRLYYTPMFVNQLRFIDLGAKSPSIYYFDQENLSVVTDMNNEANHMTRMVIGADGNGYSLNNDASHLVKFTTGKNPHITDLGNIQDDPENGQLSIHTRNTSWGGDMVADAMGYLYLVSANRAVFKIDINKKIATYITTIRGLPENYTTNGAVVDVEGNIVVSSANSIAGYYRIDMETWQASLLTSGNTQVFNTSDLANGNLANADKIRQMPNLFNREVVNENIKVYPNPVTEGMFRVSFNKNETGKYEIQLVDITGKIMFQKNIVVGTPGQLEEITVGQQLAKGVYLLKVRNNKKTVLAGKINLQ